MEIMDISKMSKTQLKQKCKELGLKKYTTKNKEELIELIKKQPTTENLTESTTENILQPIESDIQNICGLEYLKTINNNSISIIVINHKFIFIIIIIIIIIINIIIIITILSL